MAESPGSRVSIEEGASCSCLDAASLAAGFGDAVFEPAWWPEDAGPIDYSLDRLPLIGLQYTINSTRADETTVTCIGRHYNPRARVSSHGNWHAIPELSALAALVSTSDATVHAVIHRDGQTLHFIGYASEAEVITAIKSLRRVTARP